MQKLGVLVYSVREHGPYGSRKYCDQHWRVINLTTEGRERYRRETRGRHFDARKCETTLEESHRVVGVNVAREGGYRLARDRPVPTSNACSENEILEGSLRRSPLSAPSSRELRPSGPGASRIPAEIAETRVQRANGGVRR